jgi:predicted CoA-substrate-specific enzyme activase
MHYIGIDVGSVSTDIVIIDSSKKILTAGIRPSGSSGKETSSALLKELFASIDKPSGESPSFVVSTGYGRRNVECMDKAVTEITCHALGAKHLFPQTDTVLDIGGQDSKAIRLDKNGMVSDFQMNDRCAAGTGRFIEVMASILETDIVELNRLYFEPGDAVNLSATCTVFAESEIISLLNDGVSKSCIAKGLFRSIAERSIQLLSIINPGSNLTLTGGVPMNPALVAEIKNTFRGSVNLPVDPQTAGALGAALLALKYGA